MYIRLYLVPLTPGATQQIVDVDQDTLILSNGKFVLPQMAASITLVQAPMNSTFTPFDAQQLPISLATATRVEARVCWKEPVSTDDYPSNEIVTEIDPTGGVCVCGITCLGTEIAYVQVMNVAVTA